MDDITEGPLLVRREGDVHVVTLNRPDRLNAVDKALWYGLLDLLPPVDRDPETRAVIVTGAGRGFCAGGDLKAAQEALAAGAHSILNEPADRIFPSARAMIHMFLSLEKPFIAAVNGPAAGFGAVLALFMDVVVMADEASIGDRHVNAGLVAGDGGAVIFPLLVGPNRAKEYLMTGRMLSGQAAAAAGLVNYSVPRAELDTKARELAAELAALPVYAARATKALVNKQTLQMATLLLDTSLAYERVSSHSETRFEAISAFGGQG